MLCNVWQSMLQSQFTSEVCESGNISFGIAYTFKTSNSVFTHRKPPIILFSHNDIHYIRTMSHTRHPRASSLQYFRHTSTNNQNRISRQFSFIIVHPSVPWLEKGVCPKSLGMFCVVPLKSAFFVTCVFRPPFSTQKDNIFNSTFLFKLKLLLLSHL